MAKQISELSAKISVVFDKNKIQSLEAELKTIETRLATFAKNVEKSLNAPIEALNKVLGKYNKLYGGNNTALNNATKNMVAMSRVLKSHAEVLKATAEEKMAESKLLKAKSRYTTEEQKERALKVKEQNANERKIKNALDERKTNIKEAETNLKKIVSEQRSANAKESLEFRKEQQRYREGNDGRRAMQNIQNMKQRQNEFELRSKQFEYRKEQDALRAQARANNGNQDAEKNAVFVNPSNKFGKLFDVLGKQLKAGFGSLLAPLLSLGGAISASIGVAKTSVGTISTATDVGLTPETFQRWKLGAQRAGISEGEFTSDLARANQALQKMRFEGRFSQDLGMAMFKIGRNDLLNKWMTGKGVDSITVLKDLAEISKNRGLHDANYIANLLGMGTFNLQAYDRLTPASASDVLSQEQLNNGRKLNEALVNLRQAIDKSVAELTPVLTDIVNFLTSIVSFVRKIYKFPLEIGSKFSLSNMFGDSEQGSIKILGDIIARVMRNSFLGKSEKDLKEEETGVKTILKWLSDTNKNASQIVSNLQGTGGFIGNLITPQAFPHYQSMFESGKKQSWNITINNDNEITVGDSSELREEEAKRVFDNINWGQTAGADTYRRTATQYGNGGD